MNPESELEINSRGRKKEENLEEVKMKICTK